MAFGTNCRLFRSSHAPLPNQGEARGEQEQIKVVASPDLNEEILVVYGTSASDFETDSQRKKILGGRAYLHCSESRCEGIEAARLQRSMTKQPCASTRSLVSEPLRCSGRFARGS